MNNKNIRWIYLAIGTVTLIFAGIIYGWSILKVPLAAEFGWSTSALSLNFTLTMCFFCFGGMLGGALIKKIGFRLTCAVSAALSFLGFVLASASDGNIAVLYIGYGLLAGLGIGATYNAIISTVSVWFSEKKVSAPACS